MVRTVEQLFPGHQVVLGKRPRDSLVSYRFLPRSSKQLVPLRGGAELAHTIRRFSAATSTREGLIRSVSSVGLRLSPVVPFSEMLHVRGSGESILTHLGALLDQPITVSIGIGTERANRKPVLEVFGTNGQPLAFAKIGVDSVSISDVAEEAAALRLLDGLELEGIEVPRLISADRWLGNLVVVMTPLESKWSWRDRRREIPVAQMNTLSRSFGTETMSLRSTPFFSKHVDRISSLPQGDLSERVASALRDLDGQCGAIEVETGSWHGDWTPWNMSPGAQALKLWDFERFDPCGLVGLDRRHYAVNEVGQRLGTSRQGVLSTLDGQDTLEAREGSQALSGCYLLAIATRYVSRMGTQKAHLISDRAGLMVECLERWLERGRERQRKNRS